MNKKLLQNILTQIPMMAFVLFIGMLSACSNDFHEPNPDTGEVSDYDVSIHLTAGNQSLTRSILPEEFGTAIENKVNLGDLKILIFDDNDILKDILYNDTPAADNVKLIQTGAVDYVLTAKLDHARYPADSKFAVAALVNWGPLEYSPVNLEIGSTQLDDIRRNTFVLNNEGADTSWMPEGESLIPMFGVLYTSLKGYSNDIFNQGNPMDLGTVNLLRSVVKIEVIDNSNDEGVEITSIVLVERNTRGYLLPEIRKGVNTGQVTSSNIPSGDIGMLNHAGYTSTHLEFTKEGNKYVVYVPEMRLSDDLEERMDIVVNIRYHDFDDTRLIALSPYDENRKPYKPADGWPDEWKSLLRNHIYRFTINKITADPALDLIVDIQPFSNVNLWVDLGLERTEEGYIIVRDQNGNILKYIRTDGSELTLKLDNSWPYLGEFMGVFDSSKRVLIGYFINDNRSIIFNYSSDDFDETHIYENLESWEIYSSPNLRYADGTPIPEHLEETFCFIDYYNDGVNSNEIIKHSYTHTTLDDKGRVIEEYRYVTLEAFQNHKTNNSEDNRTKLADYTGNRYGDKTITYYKENGDIKCQLKVTGNTEEYNYDNFQK